MEIKFDKTKLDAYLKDFYELTHMRIVFFDAHSKVISSYPEEDSPFCRLVQGRLGMKEGCFRSNEASFAECKKSNRICAYHCHASLMEVTAVLRSKGAVLGYAMMGQCSDIKDKGERYLTLKKHFSSLGKDVSPYKKEIDRLTYKDPSQFKSAARILEALTNYLLLENYISMNKERFVEELDSYIDSRQKERIEVDDLCRHFGYGRTKLYEYASRYLDMPVSKYVSYRKMEKAKKLLLDDRYKVVDVAFLLGYEEANYFCRLFKKTTHLTPLQYKNKHL